MLTDTEMVAWLDNAPLHGLVPATDALDSLPATQERNKERAVPWSIRFLDDSMGALYATDLALLAADTGVGKSTSSRIIAAGALATGKRVALFDLEGYEGEVVHRMVYTEVQRLAWKHCINGRYTLTFGRWANGLAGEIHGLDEHARETVRAQLKGLFVRYRGAGFAPADIRREFPAIAGEVDLLILDHVHYVDKDDDDDNRALLSVASALRDVAVQCGKPVIGVSHLRKRGVGAARPLIPSTDDIHGSSDLSKIATRIISLAPAFDRENPEKGIALTYCRATKDRWDGVKGISAVLRFDMARARYADEYLLGRFSYAGNSFEEFTRDEVPNWCSCPDTHALPTMRR